MRRCNNVSALHWPLILADQDGAVVAYCKLCGEQKVFRKDPTGRMNNTEYSKWFKRDIIQNSQPLYYKYHESDMSII
jgi:hypothetical protein